MRQLDILFITAALPYPPTDGAKIRLFSLLRYLAARHNVSLISFMRDTEDRSAVEELRRYCGSVSVVERDPGYSPLKLAQGLFSTTPFPVMQYRNARMAGLVAETVTKGSFDIIQAESLHVAQYCLGWNNVTILDLLGIESSVMKRYADKERHSLKRVYAEITSKKLAEYERDVCGRFTHCLVCSEEDRLLLRKVAPIESVSVIPNGVDLETYSPNGAAALPNNRIVFVGRMDYHANVSGVRWFCEEILPLIRARRPNVLFQIVGGEPTKEVRSLAVPGLVEVTGFVEDVRPYLREATVVVVPLQVGGGTRLKIMEALAMGKPVVSTTVGAEGIAVVPERHILMADDPGEMVRQIFRALDSPPLRRQLGAEGRRLVEDRYSWDTIGQHLEQIYESCLRQSHN